MCPTRHFVYIVFNPVFQLSTAENKINLFNNHVLIVAPVTFAPAGTTSPSAEFLFMNQYPSFIHYYKNSTVFQLNVFWVFFFGFFVLQDTRSENLTMKKRTTIFA